MEDDFCSRRIASWNKTLGSRSNTPKDCKFCGKKGLKWNPADQAKTGKWRLFEGKEVHKCIKTPKPPAPLTEKEIKKAEAAGKRVYQLRKPPNEKA